MVENEDSVITPDEMTGEVKSSQHSEKQDLKQVDGQKGETAGAESTESRGRGVSLLNDKTPFKEISCGEILNLILGVATLAVTVYVANLAKSELESLKSSITQQTATDVYSVGLQTSTLLIENPELRIYFEDVNDFFSAKAVPRNSSSGFRTKSQRDEQWLVQRKKAEKALKNEAPKARAKVWSYAEFLADFLELAFVNRNLLQPDDWKLWWYYICDQYDGSAALREYCRVRGGEDARKWYSFVDEVNKSDFEREQFVQRNP